MNYFFLNFFFIIIIFFTVKDSELKNYELGAGEGGRVGSFLKSSETKESTQSF